MSQMKKMMKCEDAELLWKIWKIWKSRKTTWNLEKYQGLETKELQWNGLNQWNQNLTGLD